MAANSIAANIPGDVLALICKEMVAKDHVYDVGVRLAPLRRVCVAWNNLLGVDAFLWAYIDTCLSVCGEPGRAARRLQSQMEVHKRYSRNVKLHLIWQQEHLHLLWPYLNDMADRWASMRVVGKEWRETSLTELADPDGTPPLSFPALRQLDLEGRNIVHDSNLDFLACGPAVRELRLRLWTARASGGEERNTPIAPLRISLPVSAVLTSLVVKVAGKAGLHSGCLYGALQRCSATLEAMEITTNRTFGEREPIAMPRLRKLCVHSAACSLLQVLRMESLMTLWVNEWQEEDRGLELLSAAFEDGMIVGSTLRELQLTNVHHEDRSTSMELVISILEAASSVEALALVYPEYEEHVPSCLDILTVLSQTRHGTRMPRLRSLTLAAGVNDGYDTTDCLERFLRTRDRADLHIITDIDDTLEDHMCTYTVMGEGVMDRYYLSRD